MKIFNESQFQTDKMPVATERFISPKKAAEIAQNVLDNHIKINGPLKKKCDEHAFDCVSYDHIANETSAVCKNCFTTLKAKWSEA